jgi:hypothetical protein
MSRRLVRSLAFVALLGLSSPLDVFAQATTPQPKFTITGFIDTVATWSQNLSQSDLNFNLNRDHQFYGRNRGRFDIIGEVGEVKGVFGFEIDAYWGQTGFSDTTGIGNGEPCFTTGTGNTVTCGAAGQGAESSFDLNTDTQGSLQVKWLYVEFPLPLVPFPIVARLGAQPFATAATYKLAAYANGDFAGVNFYATFTPTVRAQVTYVALDENLLGKGAFGPVVANSGTVQNKCITSTATIVGGVSTPAGLTGNCFPQSRGDNWAFIVSPEITVMKSLDIKPMFSPVFIDGLTSSVARPGRAGVSNGPGGPFAPINSPNANGSPGVGGADGAGTGTHEYRYTVGVDARWREGPWSVEPTILYQFGSQTKWNPGGVASAYGTAGTKQTAEISAWLGDFRGSYQWGPVLLSAMSMFTTGQDAKSNPYKSIKYFNPLDTDTGYLADWGTQIVSLGVDYYQNMFLNPGQNIGWDKYGRVSSAVKASYAWTPALTVGASVMPIWTWSKVDTDAVRAGPTAGLQPNFVCRKTLQSCRPEGESNFVGTEWDVTLTYSIAPGLVFDWAAGYLQSDSALAHRYVTSQYNAGAGLPVRRDIGVNPIAIATGRVRFSF